jgi:hypothetical protein
MTYTGASSDGWAGRFMGTCSPKCVTASTGVVEGINAVQTGPGATALARIDACDKVSECARASAERRPPCGSRMLTASCLIASRRTRARATNQDIVRDNRTSHPDLEAAVDEWISDHCVLDPDAWTPRPAMLASTTGWERFDANELSCALEARGLSYRSGGNVHGFGGLRLATSCSPTLLMGSRMPRPETSNLRLSRPSAASN